MGQVRSWGTGMARESGVVNSAKARAKARSERKSASSESTRETRSSGTKARRQSGMSKRNAPKTTKRTSPTETTREVAATELADALGVPSLAGGATTVLEVAAKEKAAAKETPREATREAQKDARAGKDDRVPPPLPTPIASFTI